MTRDNRDRLSLFTGVNVIVERLALNMSQVEELKPPPNPAKLTDSRALDYIEKFGDSYWELDALEPAYLARLIDEALARVRDQSAYDKESDREANDRRYIEAVAKRAQDETR